MKLSRTSLGFFPTPIHALSRLTEELSKEGPCPALFIKRDDQTGLATGGNKTRKLEFLIGAALAEGCDTIITGGAAQSNHCRQTAAAAAKCGLECHLVLGGLEPEAATGNLLLDHWLGAHLHWCGDNRKGEDIPAIADALRAAGRKPYLVPYGGSNSIGAAGFISAMEELQAQTGEPFSHIVFASSSGGTHAGMLVGKSRLGLPTEILGIAIDKEEHGGKDFPTHVLDLTNETADQAALSHRFTPQDIHLDHRFVGAGYGVIGELERDAITKLARTEGILVDPVYTGRAFGALLAMVRNGEFTSRDKVLFWHTGGTPALFA